MRDPFAKAKRIVVKIGSALLIDSASGQIHREWLNTLCADVAALQTQGKDVILVSSGAIGLGRRALGLKNGVLKLEESQAAAAAGQVPRPRLCGNPRKPEYRRRASFAHAGRHRRARPLPQRARDIENLAVTGQRRRYQ